MIVKKTRAEIDKMREAGSLVAKSLNAIGKSIVPGKTTTFDVDRIAAEVIAKGGGKPSFKGYRGYPANVCASVNDQVVHGIPGKRVLEPGDVVGVDVGVLLDGWQGDAAQSFAVGEISPEAQKLLRVTKEALFKGIEQARPGKRVGDIGHAVQEWVERHGYSVVRTLVGHGIGRNMHEEPQVPNFGQKGRGSLLEEGMTLAIEPMVNMGRHEIKQLRDGWTVVTRDGSLSAHFEHTVAVTRGEPDILTMELVGVGGLIR
jgi:methionyl aminopeptidase